MINKTKIDSGGFRTVWLVFIETIAYGSILTIGLKYSFLVAVPLALIPFLVVIKKIADNEPVARRYRIDNWLADKEKAEQQGLQVPGLESYVIIEAKPEKAKVAKRRLLGSSPSFKQIKIPRGSSTKKPTVQSA